MKGLVVTTENVLMERDYKEPLYKTIGKDVGGWIEICHPRMLPQPFVLVCNEEGRLLGLEPNPFGCIVYDTPRHGQPIVGDVVLMKEGFNSDGEPDIVGLEKEEIIFLGAMICSLVPGAEWEDDGK